MTRASPRSEIGDRKSKLEDPRQKTAERRLKATGPAHARILPEPDLRPPIFELRVAVAAAFIRLADG